MEIFLKAQRKYWIIQKARRLRKFVIDSKTIDAVVRNFARIGEAANRLSEDFKDQHSTIDWHRIRGFRNRIVYDYFGIDYMIVWQIKETFLVILIDQLAAISLNSS
ncbi:MAG: DUF86 domain-containing protein [Chitinophagaceae bacterium]|nr:DUF86 domain-containing protein [Chitinophagaceae bacterium]